MRNWLLLLLCCAGTFYGRAQNISGVVNVYRKVLWADSAKGAVKLSNVSGFDTYVGRRAMIIQMKGASVNGGSATSDANFGNINAVNEAGNYDIGTICGFLSDTMILERKFNNFYNVSGLVQCIIFPDLTGNVTVTDTLKAQPWDSTAGTGGVIALEVPGTLTLNKPIDAEGAGFRGADYLNYSSGCTFTTGATDYYMPYNATGSLQGGKKGEGIAAHLSNKEYGRGKLTNGGGGGNRFNAGGAGGGNYGAGGQGGNRIAGACQSNSAAVGGLGLTSYYSQGKWFMGGGGGGGHSNDDYGLGGGHGGGIVYIKANGIVAGSATPGDNTIRANGARPARVLPSGGSASNASSSDGSGGGGGGGVVVLDVPVYTGNITVEAKGAKGGDSEVGGNLQCCGPGGGGGGGVIYLSLAATPGNVTTSVGGGANGTTLTTFATCPVGSANSAASGSAGNTLFNFALAAPRDSSPVCRQMVPLYVRADISGLQQGGQRSIVATVSHPELTKTCALQKAAATGNFITLTQHTGNGQPQYYFTDAQGLDKLGLYRIQLRTKDGAIVYSPVLRMGNGVVAPQLQLAVYPNPSRQKMTVQVYAQSTGMATFAIANVQGGRLWQQQQWLQKGYNVLPLSIESWPEGVLLLTVRTATGHATTQLVKLGK
jgi:hypothetical protein